MRITARKILSAVVGGLVTILIFYIIPDIIVGYTSIFAASYGISIPHGLLSQVESLKEIGWGFVILSIALPLLGGTIVGGVVDALMSAYIIYVIYYYLGLVGRYSISAQIPVRMAGSAFTIPVSLSFELGILYYLIIAPFALGIVRGIVEVFEHLSARG